MKELLKTLLSVLTKKTVIISVASATVVTFVCSSLYLTQLKDSKYDDSAGNRTQSIPYIVQDEIGKAFGENGVVEGSKAITTKKIADGYALDIDIDEIVDKVMKKAKKNNTVLGDYIKEEETLKLMIKTQLVTQYPDLRKKDKIRGPVGMDEFQGCIRFTRYRYGEEVVLEYIPLGEPEDMGEDTLYGKIYNANNKSADQELADGYMKEEDALDYFSLDTAGNLIIVQEERVDTKGANAAYMTAYEENEVSDYTGYVLSDRKQSGIEEMKWSPEWEYKIKTINYSIAVQKYLVPFEYLWAFQVCGRDEQFIKDFANYILQSEIDIGIFDNIASEESEVIENQANTNTWIRHKTITRVYTDGTLTEGPTDSGWFNPPEKPELVPRSAELKRTMEYFDTIETSIIKADVWLMLFFENRVFEETEHTNPGLANFEVNREAPDNPEDNWQDPELEGVDVSTTTETTTTTDENGNEQETSITITTEVAKWKSISIWQNQKANTRATKAENLQDRVEYKYNITTTRTTPKNDKRASEGDNFYPNFCTLYNESRKLKSNLENSMNWFFEVLMNNATTVNFVPITKYMLYYATDKKYGSTDVDFSLYAGGDISKVTIMSIANTSGGIDVSNEKYFPNTVEQFRQGIKAYSKPQILSQYAESFVEFQNKYGVNAFFAATVSVWETGAGTTGHAVDGKNNMFNIRAESKFKDYENVKESMEAFYKLISGVRYFGSGKKTIVDIGNTYCPNAEVAGQATSWIQNVQTTMIKMLKKANIDITLIENSEIQPATRNSVTIYKMVFQGITLTTPIDVDGSKVAVSSYAGKIRNLTGTPKQHHGIDVSTGGQTGKNVYAAAGGVVGMCGWQDSSNHSKGYGLRLYINHGNGVQTVYAHASELLVSTGDRVEAGQLIMKSGNSGSSTGPHLHFEIHSGNIPYHDLTNLLFGYVTTFDK